MIKVLAINNKKIMIKTFRIIIKYLTSFFKIGRLISIFKINIKNKISRKKEKKYKQNYLNKNIINL